MCASVGTDGRLTAVSEAVLVSEARLVSVFGPDTECARMTPIAPG